MLWDITQYPNWAKMFPTNILITIIWFGTSANAPDPLLFLGLGENVNTKEISNKNLIKKYGTPPPFKFWAKQ